MGLEIQTHLGFEPATEVAARGAAYSGNLDWWVAGSWANTRNALERVAGRAGLDLASCSMVATDAMFAVVPPVAALELMVIRLLMTRRLRNYRSNIIAELRKPSPAAVDYQLSA